ncbi:MAG: hypothetical protein R6T98_12995 [Desulfatiglandales bacterium]
MKNLAIFTIPKKTMDFFEVTGGLRLDSVLEGTPPRKGEPPARREGCCLFVTYQWGNPQAPIYRGNGEGLVQRSRDGSGTGSRQSIQKTRPPLSGIKNG